MCLFLLELEGEALLSSLANRHPCHVQHILLNGQSISLSSFSKRVAYIPAEAKLAPNLSVAQTLAFYSHLRKAPIRAIPKVSQTDQVREYYRYLIEYSIIYNCAPVYSTRTIYNFRWEYLSRSWALVKC